MFVQYTNTHKHTACGYRNWKPSNIQKKTNSTWEELLFLCMEITKHDPELASILLMCNHWRNPLFSLFPPTPVLLVFYQDWHHDIEGIEEYRNIKKSKIRGHPLCYKQEHPLARIEITAASKTVSKSHKKKITSESHRNCPLRLGSHWCNVGKTQESLRFPHCTALQLCSCDLLGTHGAESRAGWIKIYDFYFLFFYLNKILGI